MIKRFAVAVCAFFLFVAATQFAMRGIHNPSGNTGWLGSNVAGVEGQGGGSNPGVYGRGNDGKTGTLGGPSAGATGTNASGSTHASLGTVDSAVAAYASCTNCRAVYAQSSGTSSRGIEAAGVGAASGVYATSGSGTAVYGNSSSGTGIWGLSSTGTAIYGNASPGGGGYAGWFDGRLHVNGTLSKSAGSFRIDHPLEPATKYLSHSFVESPDMKNIYDGTVILDEKGRATVELPEWFEALNKDFRYQLTTIGEHAPVYIAEEINENRFRIAGGYAGMKVSWQVTGSRNDVYAQAYPIAVEELKPPQEMGRFLHPELHGAPLNQRVRQPK